MHICPAPGCERTIADRFLMCPADWRRVPGPLQNAVYAAYRGGAGVGSDALYAAQAAAIRAVSGETAGSPS